MEAPLPTLVDLLHRAGASDEAGIRVIDRHDAAEWLPWSAIRRRALQVAGGLQAIGIEPGDRVALIFPTSPGFFDAFFGALLAGGIPVPMYPPVRLGRLDQYRDQAVRMIDAVRASVVLADGGVRRLLGEVIERARPPLGCRTIDDLPAGEASPASPTARDLALIQFSSGTTRDPQPVALSHRAVAWQAITLNGFWPDEQGVVHSGASWLPLYHDMGLIGCVFPALERPGTVTLLPPEAFVASPARWLQTIARYRATISPAPNFAYSLCTRKIRDEELEGVDLSCWRVALSGAETVVPDVLRAFARRFAPWGFRGEALTPVYGLSEASLAVTFTPVGRGVGSRRFERASLERGGLARPTAEGREIVSVGQPIPGTAVRIVGEDGLVLAEGRLGEVECRGPSVMEGYFDRPDATAAACRDGWLRTGDLGFVLEGELYLAGRLRDILLVHGRNHSPEEVEAAAGEVPGVRAGCVVAASWLPEDADGEQVLVLAEAARGVRASRFDAIARACGDAVLAATALPPGHVAILAPGTLPRTSSGKLRRREALRQYLAGELRPPAPVTAPRVTLAIARSMGAFLRARLRKGGSAL
ncbi:MAG TPA: fatty acyl-AMP ligase [Vicinamibacterales bacterium]|nr:fatty acyl-AMP ligase [Vicinamibacterales bacterium]